MKTPVYALLLGLTAITIVLLACAREQSQRIETLEREVLETQLLHQDLANHVHSRFPTLHDRTEGLYHLLFQHHEEWFYPTASGSPDGIPGLSSESEGGR